MPQGDNTISVGPDQVIDFIFSPSEWFSDSPNTWKSGSDVVHNLFNRLPLIGTIMNPLSDRQIAEISTQAAADVKRAGGSDALAQDTAQMVSNFAENRVSDESGPVNWPDASSIVSGLDWSLAAMVIGAALTIFILGRWK